MRISDWSSDVCSSDLWGRSSNGAYAYGAATAGIHQLTRMLASDLTAQGVNANAIAPGFFPSDMTDCFLKVGPGLKVQVIAGFPDGRVGSPEVIGGGVIFLCSGGGSCISGTLLCVSRTLGTAGQV